MCLRISSYDTQTIRQPNREITRGSTRDFIALATHILLFARESRWENNRRVCVCDSTCVVGTHNNTSWEWGRWRKRRQKLTKMIAHRIPTFTFTVERSFLALFTIEKIVSRHVSSVELYIRVAHVSLHTHHVKNEKIIFCTKQCVYFLTSQKNNLRLKRPVRAWWNEILAWVFY